MSARVDAIELNSVTALGKRCGAGASALLLRGATPVRQDRVLWSSLKLAVLRREQVSPGYRLQPVVARVLA